MQWLRDDGVELEYETIGSGEPAVLIHGFIVADAYVPMMADPSLRGYKLIRYRRRGFGGSTHPESAVSIRDQAADCLALIRELKVGSTHVVGHSYGGVIGLQLALDHSEAVRSLALLEPALVGVIPKSAAFVEQMTPIIQRYEQGDKLGVLEAFLNLAVGPAIDRLPGAEPRRRVSASLTSIVRYRNKLHGELSPFGRRFCLWTLRP